MIEPIEQFEERKRDHIALALKSENEALGLSGLDKIELVHEALPDLNFSEIDIHSRVFGNITRTPFLVSSMTAGHAASPEINKILARACSDRGWLMGVGSQRRELFDVEAFREWKAVRAQAPQVHLLGNIGLSQLNSITIDQIKNLVDALEAVAMIVHLNPLQECLQPEGTPDFRGGLLKLGALVKGLSVPVVVKETGCGFSIQTLKRLQETGVAAVDVSGFGGTHWGRIEGQRHHKNSVQSRVAATFSHWGVSTLDSLLNARSVIGLSGVEKDTKKVHPTGAVRFEAPFEVWASGGIRTGLDAAKALALGANVVGFAKPILQAALKGEGELQLTMKVIEAELKTAMFCTGIQNIKEFNEKRVWQWRQKMQTT